MNIYQIYAVNNDFETELTQLDALSIEHAIEQAIAIYGPWKTWTMRAEAI
jgi:hypothetical protein